MAALRAISIYLCAVGTTHAATFLGSSSHDRRVVKEAVEQALLWELSGADADVIKAIKADILPMYASMPRSSTGRLESSTARYTLQRYFAQKHGWVIKGFDPSGSANQSSLPHHEMMKEMVPSYIQSLLSERHSGQGWDFDDLASLAATLQSLIHGESVTDLEVVYDALSLPTHGTVSADDFEKAVRGYLAVTFVGQNVTINEKDTVEVLESEAKSIFASFDDIVMSVSDTRRTLEYFEKSHINPFIKHEGVSFSQAVDVTRKIPDFFSTITKGECSSFKESLIKMEVGGTGRVPLTSFYGNKKLPMHESMDYLRNLGVMEEQGFSKPRLIIPNYINSVSRCVSFSNYYQVCCPDSCEDIQGHIERTVASPTAEPKILAELVAALPSETVDAPRQLTPQLLERLDEIAQLHQGRVPIHGRMFKQWLHHAYPRECPFPHLKGAYQPATQDQWLEWYEDLDDAMASSEEKAAFLETAQHLEDVVEPVPWTAAEELVAVDHVHGNSSATWWVVARPLMAIVLVFAFGYPLAQSTSKLFLSAAAEKEHSGHFV